VGGIGIMNIMLVSVTERTREIGIRMSIGARGSDILAQFLTEAVVLSLIGGLVGVGLGIGIVLLVPRLTGLAAVVPMSAIALSVGFAALVGIAFGVYPARRRRNSTRSRRFGTSSPTDTRSERDDALVALPPDRSL
jgi:putative ABC transport system permease protein